MARPSDWTAPSACSPGEETVMAGNLLVEQRGDVLLMTFNRPQVRKP
jgi:hypothetical protein